RGARTGRRIDQLRLAPRRQLPACGHLCRSHLQWCQAERAAGRVVNQARAHRQSQDRQGPRPDRAGYDSRPRRRGDRMMRRREFITLLGGAAAWPLAARAQQPAMPLIGYLNSRSRGTDTPFFAAFHPGLNETGYVEGQNVAIEYRWADGQYDRLPVLATDLVRRRVTVMAATSTPAALAAKAATSAIPIVFTTAADPIAIGLVDSLSRPSGNATGVNIYLSDLGAKRLELLRELIPNAAVIGMLVNPNFPDAESQSNDVKEAARTLGQQLHVVNANSEGDFNQAFATFIELK